MTVRCPAQAEDLLRFITLGDVQMSPSGDHLVFERIDIDAGKDAYRTSLWLVSRQGGAPRCLTPDTGFSAAPRWSPDGRHLAYLSDQDGPPPQLWVMPIEGGRPRRLTSQPRGVGVPAWAPCGTRLAYVVAGRAEEGLTTCAPELGVFRPRVVDRACYKSDGMGYTLDARSSLWMVGLDGSAERRLTSDEVDDRSPAFSPDGRFLVFSRTRRELGTYQLADLWRLDLDGGDCLRLTRDVVRASLPSWSPDGRTIACYGQDGPATAYGEPMWRVYVLPAEGGEARLVAPAYDRSVFLQPPPGGCPPPAWTENGEAVHFLAADRGSIHVVQARLSGGRVQARVGGERHVLAFHAHRSGAVAFCAHHLDNPGELYISDPAGERRLTGFNDDVLSRVTIPRTERMTFDSPYGPHGPTIEGWLSHPLDGRRPAPLLLEIHGGPHSFAGTGFPFLSYHRWPLAAAGWSVLALNPQGSGSYGREFAHAIRGRWGELDHPEHMAAVEALVARGIADPERLALTGYSYGSLAGCWILIRERRFKAAVLGGTVVDLESFYGTSDIGPWFAPWQLRADFHQERDVFRRLSPLGRAHEIETPTLILHGEADDRCPIGQSEQLFASLVATGKAPTMFVRYPGTSHFFQRAGRPSHRVDSVLRLCAWVQEHVRSGVPTA